MGIRITYRNLPKTDLSMGIRITYRNLPKTDLSMGIRITWSPCCYPPRRIIDESRI